MRFNLGLGGNKDYGDAPGPLISDSLVEPPSNNSVILIVDDTPENVDVLAGVLREHYQIKVVLNGPKALKIAQSDPVPALIVLDVMMPETDGYQVCLLSIR